MAAETLIGTVAAAKVAKVNRGTIRHWVNVGRLTPAAYSPQGYKLYRLADVLGVEKGKQPPKGERRAAKNDWLKRLRRGY